jgi:ketosteroid isomerase-like protein
MKCHFVLLSLLVLVPYLQTAHASGPAVLQPCKTEDEAAIRHIAERWKEGYNGGNAADVASLYEENAFYLTQHFVTGILHGRTAIKAYVQRGVDAGYHIDSIDILSSECSGKLAYTVGRYEATNAGQKAVGVNLVVLKKTGKKWLIAAHEAAVPDPATAVQ